MSGEGVLSLNLLFLRLLQSSLCLFIYDYIGLMAFYIFFANGFEITRLCLPFMSVPGRSSAGLQRGPTGCLCSLLPGFGHAGPAGPCAGTALCRAASAVLGSAEELFS